MQGLGLSVELLNEDIDKYAEIEKVDQDESISTPIGWDDISEEPLELLEIEELNLNDDSNLIVEEEESEESKEIENQEEIIEDDTIINLEDDAADEPLEVIDESVLEIEFEDEASEDSKNIEEIK